MVQLEGRLVKQYGIPTELCSPDTEDDLSLHITAWVISEAGEGNAGIVFNSINSYGKTLSGHEPCRRQQQCLFCPSGWRHRRRLLQQRCHAFLRDLERLVLQILIKMVVKIADHEQPRPRCVLCRFVWCRRQRRNTPFLRIYSYLYKGIFSC